MRTLKIVSVIGLLTAAAAANAAVTATVTATNDYDFRGFTQSAGDPALQASVDYAHDSGWYLGAWGSNIDFGTDHSSPFGDPSLEVDFYTGFKKSLDSGLGYDVGLVYYTYHLDGGSDFNYLEAYGGVSYKWISGKLFYSPDFGGKTTNGNTPAEYISVDASIPLPANFSIIGHGGYSFGDYWDDIKDAGGTGPYFDYAVGVGLTAGKFTLALKWIDGSDFKEAKKSNSGTDVFNTEGRVVFTVATTFPW